MIRFVLFGKYLEENCRAIDHVPPLHEIDWNRVRDLTYRQAHQTMVEMNKQYASTLHRQKAFIAAYGVKKMRFRCFLQNLGITNTRVTMLVVAILVPTV